MQYTRIIITIIKRIRYHPDLRQYALDKAYPDASLLCADSSADLQIRQEVCPFHRQLYSEAASLLFPYTFSEVFQLRQQPFGYSSRSVSNRFTCLLTLVN